MKFTEQELKDILEKHSLWLSDNNKGERANLSRANLQGANLYGANLQEANLKGAYLQRANLSYAYLREANLSYAYLREANLQEANLREANLQEANLTWAYLREANLQEANLKGANLQGANLQEANLPDFRICPEKGFFTAWKKVRGAILELEIRGKAICTPVGRKCRTDKAFVVEAFGQVPESGVLQSLKEEMFIYEVGKEVTSEVDEDIRIECTKGIHFFMTRKEAEEYGFF